MNNLTKKPNLWRDPLKRLKENRLAIAGFWTLLTIVGSVIFIPLFSSTSYETQNLSLGAVPPSFKHLFGTDTFGRDLFIRVMYGGRISVAVGITATVISIFIGVLWGTISGFKGGKTDAFMMRFVDILYALPFMIFIILLMVIFGRNIFLLFVSIGAVEWLTMARIIRSQVKSLKEKEFIEAAISIGLPTHVIILRHILPNILGIVVVYATLTVPNVMLLESFLSFLGLGIQPPMSSWGLLISYGIENMEEYPWLLIFPGIFLSLTLFSLNFIGDGLRDALDPKVTKR